jgi:multiple sugar transport system ATP-binding protein
VLGVRAEDVRIGPTQSGEAAGERAKISLVEPMGNHRVVWLDYHGVQIASIDQSKTPVMPGDTLAFSLDSTHVSLFDAASGARL